MMTHKGCCGISLGVLVSGLLQSVENDMCVADRPTDRPTETHSVNTELVDLLSLTTEVYCYWLRVPTRTKYTD
jgi:hypothetical protein